MSRNFLWWLAASIVVIAGSGLFVWWAQRWFERGLMRLVPAQQRPESWVVDRPIEVRRIVKAVTRRRGPATVGVTTAVQATPGARPD